eukprot:CAMPEP_0184693834 /NCGR_PEP_ID=MMETSP0313-20130426/1975_1 /TAXON_ID=2792 /ORGANISM="Porphyridium aerugineum, Strain SAG 1380-2" /LENGTH=1195 /DNA_ID=CAMNT_0027152007 /DNA_START=243 /DNA_END=3830 /DNA_ORIENTATION=+
MDSTSSTPSIYVPDRLDFPQEEAKTLAYWDSINAFHKANELSKDRPLYSFYDGPPFATGLPHYGHILAGTIKDTVTRIAYQKGFHVPRRFGWDCHGLPVEYEIEQRLGIKSKDDVVAMGIKKYNEECRSIVMRYSKEWESIVHRLGRWIDFKNDYKTLDTTFMESVWWVFKQLHTKNLVYRGFRVMPYSTACTTPLSNFEANLNYKDVNDPSVIVSFPLVEDESVSFLAWTTTPWTLPSNIALCVNSDFVYLLIQDTKSGHKYYIAEERLVQLYKNYKKVEGKPVVAGFSNKEFSVLAVCSGKDLVGKKYVPLFNYFKDKYDSTGFKIVSDGYVTNDSGTGIVHQAPAFGEDDYRVCVDHGVVPKTDLPCPVDENGRFVDPVTDFKGVQVKEADKAIMHKIKDMGRLVKQEQFFHSYPFCWRSDTPLIYKAVPSWFVKVEDIKDRLIENNKQSRWVPDFVQHKRFGNWLENARDWNVSRNRYWGTPLPIWMDETGEEIVVVGSVAELEELSGKKGITDIHRDSIDDITIVSKTSGKTLRRVEEVFDCWFESGSMPYAQNHYPFEPNSEELFKKSFPAQFIAEGLDQTRGWFYTLMVLSTALFDKPAFQNCVVNGLVLAEDGKKMSKRLKNYPDPLLVVETYGADALRLYLINSPVVRAEPLRFREHGVKEVVRDVMLPWFNSYRFLLQNVRQIDESLALKIPAEGDMSKMLAEHGLELNPMDHWIQSALGSLIHFVNDEMDAYRLYTVVPKLLGFIESLTNWYVRLNRPRLKGVHGVDNQMASLTILADVLLTLSRLMAAFAPFFSEFTYQGLRQFAPESLRAESVHFLMLPKPRDAMVDSSFERAVERMQEAICLGRVARDRHNLSVKSPLKGMTIIHPEQDVLDSIKQLENYVKSELNVRQVDYSTKQNEYVLLKAQGDGSVLGKTLGKAFGPVDKALKAMASEQVLEIEAKGGVELEGHFISVENIKITRQIKPEINQGGGFEAVHSGGTSGVLIILNIQQDDKLVEEGIAREVINRVQKLRKSAELVPEDKIDVYYHSKDEHLASIIHRHVDFILDTLRTTKSIVDLSHLAEQDKKYMKLVADENVQAIGESELRLVFTRSCLCPNRLALKDVVKHSNPSISRERVDELVDAVAAMVIQSEPSGLGLVGENGELKKEPVSLTVNGSKVVIELGKTVFASYQDKVKAENEDE